jgi:hypothetical protein
MKRASGRSIASPSKSCLPRPAHDLSVRFAGLYPESRRSAFGQLWSLRPPRPSPNWVRSGHRLARTSLRKPTESLAWRYCGRGQLDESAASHRHRRAHEWDSSIGGERHIRGISPGAATLIDTLPALPSTAWRATLTEGWMKAVRGMGSAIGENGSSASNSGITQLRGGISVRAAGIAGICGSLAAHARDSRSEGRLPRLQHVRLAG